MSSALDPSAGAAPDLLVNVTGSVLHGPSVHTHSDGPQIRPEDHPRKFHEIFLLRAAEQGEDMQPKVDSAVLDSTVKLIHLLVCNTEY